jgi:two-component system, LuxR family, response regulator FixJ
MDTKHQLDAQTRSDTLAIERPVLVIDDDPAILASLKFALEIEGFAVHTYPTAKALLADTTWKKWGCLVLDYNLPDGNGLDTLEQLRRRGVTMPAVLITTNPAPEIRKRAAEARVTIVEKPLLGNGLVETIRSTFPS